MSCLRLSLVSTAYICDNVMTKLSLNHLQVVYYELGKKRRGALAMAGTKASVVRQVVG